jgi:hypothetical protein
MKMGISPEFDVLENGMVFARHGQIPVMKTQKSAWLIGLYNNELDYRIGRLGYKLTRFFPDLHIDPRKETAPELIVISDDQFSDPNAMFRLRPLYPDAVLISLSSHLPSNEESHDSVLDPTANFSVIRLIKDIEALDERLQRWE